MAGPFGSFLAVEAAAFGTSNGNPTTTSASSTPSSSAPLHRPQISELVRCTLIGSHSFTNLVGTTLVFKVD